jgi:hypothetical protein
MKENGVNWIYEYVAQNLYPCEAGIVVEMNREVSWNVLLEFLNNYWLLKNGSALWGLLSPSSLRTRAREALCVPQ